MLSSNEKLVLVGDFNYKEIDWENELCHTALDFNGDQHMAEKFLTCTQENFLFQHVSTPTHFRPNCKPSLIDLVFSNDPNFIYDMQQYDPIGASHHNMIIFSCNFFPYKKDVSGTTKLSMNKGDYNNMRLSASGIDWDAIFDVEKDVDYWWEGFENEYKKLTKEFIPEVKARNTVKRTFTASATLLDKIDMKRKSYKYYKKFRTTENYETYVYFRNLVTFEVRKTKLEKEINLARRSKTNPKLIYQYISSKTKTKDTIPNLDKPEGGTTTDDKEKASVLNKFFGSVFTEEGDTQLPECEGISCDTILDKIDISLDDVMKILNSLNVNKSCGPDGVHPRVLKELCNELSIPLKKLFDKTMLDGRIPKKWKVAEVRPIFKKGNKASPNNYRPVSLTSIVCKIFENFVRNSIYSHLIDHDMLALEQFGFCKGRSCTTQLLVTLNDWFLNIDQNIPTDSVYLDFSKAFDCVPHKRLMSKLHSYGIRGNVYNWILDFLSDRSQFVSINNCNSDSIPVTSGVPQGSVLGPTLFVYYINDLPQIASNIVKIFANDTKLYTKITSELDCLRLQEDIDSLVKWSDKWLMKFNSSKCKILHVGKNNPKFNYTIKEGDIDVPLTETLCEKDLGVNIDNCLNFNQHIAQITKKARCISAMLLRTFTNKDPEIHVPIFKSLVRPNLEYANSVWNPYLKNDINRLEKVQKNYTKRIQGMKDLNYHQRLEKLKLPSLEYRRLRGDLIEVYKITHNIYDPISTNALFHMSNNQPNTRFNLNPYRLTKAHVNKKQFQMFFTNRVVDLWNNLPLNVVTSKSLNVFKNNVDSHFKEVMYTTNFSFSLYIKHNLQ